MNKTHIKRALSVSLISLLLTVSMLVGTTYAYFTDKSSTDVNKIVSGNLDIALYKGVASNGSVTYGTEVTEATKLFDDEALWEPGRVEVAYIKIENKGNLALKYQLKINVSGETVGKNADGEDIRLSEILKYDAVDITPTTLYETRTEAIDAVKNTAGMLVSKVIPGEMLPDDARYIALVVYMPEETGNEANYRGGAVPSVKLGVTLVATQATYESDSFGDSYDEDAVYPDCVATVNKTEYTSFAQAFNAAKDGDTVKLYGDIAISSTIPFNKSIILDLNGHTLESKASSYPFLVYAGNEVTIKNGTVKTAYAALTQGNLTLENTDLISSFSQAISPRGGVLTIDRDSSVTVTSASTSAVSISMIGNNNGANPVVNVYGRISSTGAYAIAGNGSKERWGTTINIYPGAELSSQLCGIFQPQVGEINIYGGTITALRSAVEIRAGSLNIEGGTLNATSSDFSFVANNSGLTATGVAVAISQHTTNQAISVTVSGGTFNGCYALYEKDTVAGATPSENVSIKVSGGTFNGDIISENNKLTDLRQ